MRLNLPPVLGELVGGVIIGVSALKLLVFPEGGAGFEDSLLIHFLQSTSPLTPEQSSRRF